MPVAAPTDKRFRRAHVSPTGRRGWRRPWAYVVRVVVIGAMVSYGLYSAAGMVLSAEALTITKVSVVGNTRMALGEVVSLTDELKGTSMVTADLETLRARLRELPWVQDAAIRRVFPGTMLVVISERQPMGIGRLGTQLHLVDQHGVVIGEFGPHYSELDLPIIDGLAPASRGGEAGVDPLRAALASRLIADLSLRPDLAGRLSQIDVSDVRDVAVILKDDTVLVRLGRDRFVERMQSYVDIRDALHERVDDIDYVDLRFDGRVYVRPRVSRPLVRPVNEVTDGRPGTAAPSRRGVR
jgi:cell division protein FtsQ